MSKSTMAPRGYCARNRIPAFQRSQPVQQGEPAWVKIGNGLIAVHDGSPKEYVAPGLVYGMELDGSGMPVIASYWTAAKSADGLAVTRPYTLGTCKALVGNGRMAVCQMPISYVEMVRMVRTVHPLSWIPSEDEFLAEYGVGCKGDNGHG